MIRVNIIQDESSHWYVVPIEEVDEFNNLLEKSSNGDYDAEDEFINKFSKYMTGGDINNIELYIK